MSFPAPWRASATPIYALSVGAAQVTARQPVNFSLGGGTVRLVNTGATAVLITFYNFPLNNSTDPTLTFPVTGAPPVGQPTVGAIAGPYTSTMLVPAAAGSLGSVNYLDIPGQCDSFAAIGSAAGPSIIYVQRGEGNGP
jgi:hypothetical protein